MQISAPSASRPLMCWSTGREPMAQPPGSETLASPKRASMGPSTRIEARMVLTSSYGASRVSMALPLRTTRSPSCCTFKPVWPSSLSMVETSCRFGTFVSSRSPEVKRPAHRMGRAAFFAPEMAMSPFRRLPPLMRSLSICLSLEFFRCQGFHRQRVDFLAHAVAQCRVDDLVAGDQPLAGKRGRDDHGLEVLAIALHFEVRAFEAGRQVAVDQFWSGGHDKSLILNKVVMGCAAINGAICNRFSAGGSMPAPGSRGSRRRWKD